jgi:hypothetical protein
MPFVLGSEAATIIVDLRCDSDFADRERLLTQNWPARAAGA